MRLAVIPKPVEVKRCPGQFALASVRVIHLEIVDDVERYRWLGRYLADWIDSESGADVCIRSGNPLGSKSDGSIRLIQDPGLSDIGDEGYQLTVNEDCVSITARRPAGAFYGVQTLFQLATGDANHGGSRYLPCVHINDRPRFSWRGFMLDSARHMQSVSEIKRIIDRIAALKFNRFHWHIVDDQAWRMEIRKYPRLTSVGAWRGEGDSRYGGFYSQQQVRDIVAYANDRHIIVIPEIDMPGHCNSALYAIPSLSCSGKSITVDAAGGLNAYTRDGGRRLYCAGRDEVFTFLKDVLAEVAEVFEPQYIHLGGDERPTGFWSQCPSCKKRMHELGLKSEDELEFWFASQITNYVHEQLKVRTIGWGDNLKKAGMPDGQIIQGWLEGQSEMAASLGRQTINSFHEYVYMDYPCCEESRLGKPDWMPLLPVEKVYGFEPVPEGLETVAADLVLGGEAPVWTECIKTYEQLIRQVMPRLLALSEVLWSPRKMRDYHDFQVRSELLAQDYPPASQPKQPNAPSFVCGVNCLDQLTGSSYTI